jgi:hypothetical protein
MRAFFAVLFIFISLSVQAGIVEFHDDQLFIDGSPQPQLYGAELQYFRLRGGYGKNVPRAKVIELWNKALDRMVEAKMNTISFYIPWDFHEYAEGKFDFTGTVDEDGDGNPDYPSRDLQTFFKLIEARGITRIMARPGPYINAEWGFLGFGAVPKWFHDKFPESHMRTSLGLKSKLYDYHNPDFLRYTQKWLEVVYRDVLKQYIGPGKPVTFLQIDNETNFMWQSIFNHDHGAPAVARYRAFLKSRYGNIAELNRVHGKGWSNWDKVTSPKVSGVNIAEDQDWYRFQDESMHSYLQKIRKIWDDLGVKEPTVLFTLAESYNAMRDGILPNYHHRNNPGKTGMMTVNLYPKTYETPASPLLNLPFKSDHDVKAADSANDFYLGIKNEWVFGPEIQGGWWKGIDVTEEARQQTYLSVIGHGLKALIVYYFHEGDNWQVEWAFDQIAPVYEQLKSQPVYVSLAVQELPDSFWRSLQDTIDRELMVGFDVRTIMTHKLNQEKELFFDAPLDRHLNARDHFKGLVELGQKVIAPHEEFLGKAQAVHDPVCIIRDDQQHVPSPMKKIDSLVMNGEWMGGLVGYLFQLGVNPMIHHWTLNDPADLNQCQILLRMDNGLAGPGLHRKLTELLENGKTVINFVGASYAQTLKLNVKVREAQGRAEWVSFLHDGTHSLFSATPYFYFDLPQASACSHNMFHNKDSVGFACKIGKGTLVQTGAMFVNGFNSDQYADQIDVLKKLAFMDFFLRQVGIKPAVQIKGGGDRLALFARKSDSRIWLTVKSGKKESQAFKIVLNQVDKGQSYTVTNLLGSERQTISGSTLQTEGFAGSLKSHGSTVYSVEAAR